MVVVVVAGWIAEAPESAADRPVTLSDTRRSRSCRGGRRGAEGTDAAQRRRTLCVTVRGPNGQLVGGGEREGTASGLRAKNRPPPNVPYRHLLKVNRLNHVAR